MAKTRKEAELRALELGKMHPDMNVHIIEHPKAGKKSDFRFNYRFSMK